MKVNKSDQLIKSNNKPNPKLSAIRSKNIIHSSSVIPFPKENDVFYKENKILWEKDIAHLKEEHRILNKAKQSTSSHCNNILFRKSNVFQSPLQVSTKALSPKHNLNRFRDFHSDFTQKNNWHNENAVKIKTLSPLHYKLYESSLQDDKCIKKLKLPSSYRNYNSKDGKEPKKYSEATNRKIEFYRSHFSLS